MKRKKKEQNVNLNVILKNYTTNTYHTHTPRPQCSINRSYLFNSVFADFQHSVSKMFTTDRRML